MAAYPHLYPCLFYTLLLTFLQLTLTLDKSSLFAVDGSLLTPLSVFNLYPAVDIFAADIDTGQVLAAYWRWLSLGRRVRLQRCSPLRHRHLWRHRHRLHAPRHRDLSVDAPLEPSELPCQSWRHDDCGGPMESVQRRWVWRHALRADGGEGVQRGGAVRGEGTGSAWWQRHRDSAAQAAGQRDAVRRGCDPPVTAGRQRARPSQPRRQDGFPLPPPRRQRHFRLAGADTALLWGVLLHQGVHVRRGGSGVQNQHVSLRGAQRLGPYSRQLPGSALHGGAARTAESKPFSHQHTGRDSVHRSTQLCSVHEHTELHSIDQHTGLDSVHRGTKPCSVHEHTELHSIDRHRQPRSIGQPTPVHHVSQMSGRPLGPGQPPVTGQRVAVRVQLQSRQYVGRRGGVWEWDWTCLVWRRAPDERGALHAGKQDADVRKELHPARASVDVAWQSRDVYVTASRRGSQPPASQTRQIRHRVWCHVCPRHWLRHHGEVSRHCLLGWCVRGHSESGDQVPSLDGHITSWWGGGGCQLQ